MYKLSIIISIAVLLSACNKFDSDINTNPNQPANASGTQLIANAQLWLPSLSSSPQGEFMAQYLAETQYPNASLYPEGGTSFYSLYAGPLMNLEAVINSTELNALDGPLANQLAVAKILKAYFFWHITDRWGDVPYSESLKGMENLTPVYDKQQAIYDNLFTILKEANATIVTGTITNDIVYRGDVAKWKKLANTIRLLMALRLSKINPAKGSQELNAALTDGIMTANTDNFYFKHLADANNQNYWYGQVVTSNRKWWALTKLLVDKMKPVNDPRLAVYGNTVSGQHVGLPFGTTTGMPNTTSYSLLGDAVYAQSSPVYLVTYAQALFAKAEAAKLGWITGGDTEAKNNYNMAIEQSVRQWKNNDVTGLTAMMATTDVAYDNAKALEQIATQRWIHLYMHGYEGWAEWRRTGYPALITPVGDPTRAVPRRNSYPDTESANNTANFNSAVSSQFNGANNIYGRVWWDKQ